MMPDPTHFLDGTPIPDGYLDRVATMVEIVCLIEDRLPEWELELHQRQQENRQ